ncbi:MAG: putative quinol monooxygenase [Giesbergeria sp.]
MHGLIGKMRAVAGQRDALIAILLDGVSGMPGCLSYVVAQDPADADAIWVTGVWDAIARGRPLIAGFDQHITTVPVGGHGIPAVA